MRTSLYVHIPFCLKRCIYCDFVSGLYKPEKEIAYMDALKKEISNIPEGLTFETLYIGGGTPTVLSTNTLSDLIAYIFNHLEFVSDYEATIETNPGTVDREKLLAIHSSGINRLSIGVQSFNDDELDCLGRLHSAEEAVQTVYQARDAGFGNVGIDLIYGIPGQNLKSWEETLEKAISLKPEHLSTYELTQEEGTLLHEYMKTGMLKPVAEDEIVRMYEYTIDYLTAEGFIHYEISNFALPGCLCRHNMNYWKRGYYYGIGLGAHSFTGKRRFYNTDSLDDYIMTLSEGKSPVSGSEDMTEDKALSEALFLGLRKTEGIDAKEFSRLYGKDILSLYQKELEELEQAGLVEINRADSRLRLTRKGLLLSNEVFARLTDSH